MVSEWSGELSFGGHILRISCITLQMSRVVYIFLAASLIFNAVQFLYSTFPGLYFEGINMRTNIAGDAQDVHSVSSRKLTAETEAKFVIPKGSRKVFIDLGANDGDSTAFFLNNKEGGNNIATQGGSQDSILRGMGSTGDWEIIVVEANLNFTSQLEALKTRTMEANQAKNFTILGGTAVSKTTGTVSFILDNGVSGSAGATTMPESTSAVGPHYTIPAIGIIDLFHKLKIHHTDFVVLKMDIEGYEFELVRHMLLHGLHARIDILAVEYHDINYWVFGKTDEIREKYQSLHKCLDWMMEDVHSMKTLHWGRR